MSKDSCRTLFITKKRNLIIKRFISNNKEQLSKIFERQTKGERLAILITLKFKSNTYDVIGSINYIISEKIPPSLSSWKKSVSTYDTNKEAIFIVIEESQTKPTYTFNKSYEIHRIPLNSPLVC